MSINYQEYNEIELETDIMSASRYRLIQLLFDKCLQQIHLAKTFITNHNIPLKCKAISRAMDIIGYLRICLNMTDENVKQLSLLLDSIYDYAERKLLEANLKNNIARLDEVIKLITMIKSGWDGVDQS